MLLNEIVKEVKMTKRAIKYYEEKGLLSIKKDDNGYRNYTQEDVRTLKKISVYRKLGIAIDDIKKLLETNDKKILLDIYHHKLHENQLQETQLKALKDFIDDGDPDKANELLDYETIETAIKSMLPKEEWADYLLSHFKPFLNVRIKTPEQKQALNNILEYCENTTLKTPFIFGGVKMTLTMAINQAMKEFNKAKIGDLAKISVLEGGLIGKRLKQVLIGIEYSINGDYTESNNNPFEIKVYEKDGKIYTKRGGHRCKEQK